MMDASKKASYEKYIVLGLLAVFGVALWGSLKQMGLVPSGHPASRRPAAPAPAAPAAAPVPQAAMDRGNQPAPPAASAAPASAAPSSPPVYTAQDLRDPFKSLLPEEPKPAVAVTAPPAQDVVRSAQPVAPPNLTVQGMWWGGDSPKAIINGRVYGVGDRVDGAVITGIGRGGVTIEYSGTTSQLAPTTGSASGTLSRGAASPSRWR